MKDHLRELIARGKTKQAIRELQTLSQTFKDEDLRHEVILQANRFEAYERDKRMGTASFEESNLTIARINSALLSIIGRLPAVKEEPSASISNPKLEPRPSSASGSNTPFSGKWWAWVVGIGTIIAILAGIAEFTGYSMRDWWGGETMDAFSVTVLVHGKKGKGDRILRNQGKVVLDIGDTREEESINGEGEATFKGLSSSYRGKQAHLSIDHPQPYFPTDRNQEYLLEKDQAIYLEVELKGLHKIQGRILDFETELPLDSVQVSVQNIATYTDAYGWYELNIPPDRQAKFIKVTLFKKGYGMVHLDSITPHTRQEIDYSLKKQVQ